jgi:hypothetical protein
MAPRRGNASKFPFVRIQNPVDTVDFVVKIPNDIDANAQYSLHVPLLPPGAF